MAKVQKLRGDITKTWDARSQKFSVIPIPVMIQLGHKQNQVEPRLQVLECVFKGLFFMKSKFKEVTRR